MMLGAPFALSLIFQGMILNISIHIPIKQEMMVLMSIVMFDLKKIDALNLPCCLIVHVDHQKILQFLQISW
jgi:hypothetical protein